MQSCPHLLWENVIKLKYVRFEQNCFEGNTTDFRNDTLRLSVFVISHSLWPQANNKFSVSAVYKTSNFWSLHAGTCRILDYKCFVSVLVKNVYCVFSHAT